jgi:hypothetical protein
VGVAEPPRPSAAACGSLRRGSCCRCCSKGP